MIVRSAKDIKTPRPFELHSWSWWHSLQTSAKGKCKVTLSFLGLQNYEAYDVIVKKKKKEKEDKEVRKANFGRQGFRR